MLVKIKKAYLILLLIIAFAFTIRIWHLDTNPAGFFCDEALRGIDALSILRTAHDSNGKFLPIYFEGFKHDGISPFNVYPIVPFIFIFGFNEAVIRLPSIIFSLFELVIFFFTLKQFIPSRFALLGTLFLSISPWNFHISRIAIADFYAWSFFTLIAYLFLIKTFWRDKILFPILAAIFFSLATYSYYPSRLLIPILYIIVLFLLISKRYFKKTIIFGLVYLIVLIPFVNFHLTDPYSFQRLNDTTSINLKQNKIDITMNNIFFNPFFKKYLLHYSYTFLFQKGDADFPGQFIHRHSISGLGLLYPYQSVLILLGLLWIFRKIIKNKRTELFFVIFLLLLFPLPDSLTTNDTPFATRSYLGVLPFSVLIAFGIYALFQLLLLLPGKIKTIGEITTASVLFVVIVFSVFKLLQAFVNNPLTTSDFWGWQYGPRDIMKYFLTVDNHYDDLYMSGEYNGAEIFLKFYDPENTCLGKCKIGDLWRNPAIYDPSRRQLFALSPDYLNKSDFKDLFILKKTLYYPDGKTAFLIGEVKEAN